MCIPTEAIIGYINEFEKEKNIINNNFEKDIDSLKVGLSADKRTDIYFDHVKNLAIAFKLRNEEKDSKLFESEKSFKLKLNKLIRADNNPIIKIIKRHNASFHVYFSDTDGVYNNSYISKHTLIKIELHGNVLKSILCTGELRNGRIDIPDITREYFNAELHNVNSGNIFDAWNKWFMDNKPK